MHSKTPEKEKTVSPTETPLLQVKDLSVSLGGNPILERVNLEVMPGTIHALIGPNGAGKTTLIRSIMGGMPHQGLIRFYFRNGGSIGYVPQLLEFDHSVPITVIDFFAIMLRHSPVFISGTREIRSKVKDVLASTESEHLVDRLIGGLSGGELRRVLLAQALTPLPEILLLDEPASNVDEHGAKLIEKILLRLKNDQGISVLMVGHDIRMILRISDQVTGINREVIYQGSPEGLKDAEQFDGIFCAPPDHGGGLP